MAEKTELDAWLEDYGPGLDPEALKDMKRIAQRHRKCRHRIVALRSLNEAMTAEKRVSELNRRRHVDALKERWAHIKALEQKLREYDHSGFRRWAWGLMVGAVLGAVSIALTLGVAIGRIP